ncbi:hypothetical protein [Staphylococcus xylosus]|uniref:hypothetical protein n=2 Tax=Staphylococcus xylosus TaxID=1288 RepID=UPI000D1D4640|nr:hypothetical protein [Staphylococcus xylosus]PTI64196.1 hypothetical protein BU095_06260 [Staphylococcus xylosus]
MNQELLGGIYTIAGGIALYSIKEIVRFFVDNKLNRKQSNLENIYPIYVEVFKAAKIFIGAYNTPLSQPVSLKVLNDELLEQFKRNKKFVKAYKDNEAYRYIVNLNKHIDQMRTLKKDFNNVFSANQFCFDQKFIDKTIFIDNEMNKDIENLQSKVAYCGENNISNPDEYIIDKEYIDKMMVYESYLDIFNKEFKKRFKI